MIWLCNVTTHQYVGFHLYAYDTQLYNLSYHMTQRQFSLSFFGGFFQEKNNIIAKAAGDNVHSIAKVALFSVPEML